MSPKSAKPGAGASLMASPPTLRTWPNRAAKPSEVYREICDIVDGPISLETLALDADTIVKEGVALAKIHKNVVIKVPIIKEGLKAVKVLAAEGAQDQRDGNLLAVAGVAGRQGGCDLHQPLCRAA